MMKSLLFSIGMMVSLASGIAISQALMSEEDLITALFEEAGVELSDVKDAKEIESLANNEQAPFNGLYLFMLQNIMYGPQDAAVKEIADRMDFSEEEVEAIVLEGDINPILNKQKTMALQAQSEELSSDLEEADAQGSSDLDEFVDDNDFDASTEEYIRWHYETYEAPPPASDFEQVLTTDFVLNEYNTISDAYDKELAFQRENRRIAYEALASEMFLNNNLGDSANVDLLYDLDLINYLMFGELIAYPDRSEESVETASESSDALVLFKAPEPDEEDDSILLAEEISDPYVCYGDDALNSALEAYEASPPETGDALPEVESSIDYTVGEEADEENADSGEADSEDSSGGGDGSEEDENNFSADVGAAFEALDDFLSSLETPAGDWTRQLPCGEMFCIEVKLISETDDPEVEDSSSMTVEDFKENENCIACHTAYIKDRLEETMSKSLVPSKISMNWFEDATCKEAGTFVNLDLNVYAIKKPIDLDPGDDLDDKAAKDIEEFKNTLMSIGGITLPGGTKTTLGKTLADLECESIVNINDIGGSASEIDKILAQCQEAAEENARDVQAAFEEFKFNTYSQSTSDLYGQVSAELYSILLYFQSFQEGLKATYETEDAPLSSLLTKGYCE